MKRPYGQVVGTTIVDGKLLCEIVQKIEGVAGIKVFLLLAMAALDFAVMALGIRTNGLVPNAQLGSSLFKQGRQITFAAGEAMVNSELFSVWTHSVFRFFSRKQTHFAHDAEQALRAASVAAQPQTMPEFNHAQGWISAAHVPDEFPFCFRMLVWMAVRPPGLTGKGCRTSIPALLPEVDVRPALVVFPTGAADAVFFCIPHERLPVVILLFMRDMVSFRQVAVW